MFQLTDKVAIITGAGSGIGKAMALLFAQQGAHVMVLDLNEKGGSDTVSEIKAKGGQAHFYACNVTDQQSVKKIVQSIVEEKGRIDILINNAGIAHVGTVETTSEEDFDRLMLVNVKGLYNCIHICLPHMKGLGGVILNMASIAAYVGIPDRFAYSTTKGAIYAMTKSVAKDFLHHNIRCNSISPARVHTPFVDGFIAKNYPDNQAAMFEKLSASQPIGRMAKPEEVAQLALYLCSEEASFITGNDYPVDGGFIYLNN